jgi:DNA-binding response OmpR family regulator
VTEKKGAHLVNPSTESLSGPPRCILLVEDDTDIREFLASIIQSETPYQVARVSTESQALEVARTITPQLFILDDNLPQMNGIEVYHRLHAIEELHQIPALLMSANPLIDEVEWQGITVLRKPFDIHEFFRAIEKLLA